MICLRDFLTKRARASTTVDNQLVRSSQERTNAKIFGITSLRLVHTHQGTAVFSVASTGSASPPGRDPDGKFLTHAGDRQAVT